MKRMLLFASLAISLITVSSCKKSKSPDFGGPANLISGKWQPNLASIDFAAGVIVPTFGFGTDFRYEKVSGTTDNPVTERGTYNILTLETTDPHRIILKPNGGNEYTIELKELKSNSAIFRYGPYMDHPLPYNRK